MKILYDTVLSCLCNLSDLGLEYIFPIAVETCCSHRTDNLDGDIWQHWFIVSSHNDLILYTAADTVAGTFGRPVGDLHT
jgi:hypothetical protein